MGDELSPHAGRQQQCLLPGQRDQLVRLGGRAPRTDPELLAFVQALIALRRALRRLPPPRLPDRRAPMPRHGLKDVYWLAPEGREMTTRTGATGLRRTLGMQLGNDAADGQRFLVLLNADARARSSSGLPDALPDGRLGPGLRHATSAWAWCGSVRPSCRRGTPVPARASVAHALSDMAISRRPH